MNWEEKLSALNSLTECSLKMRAPGDWYVLQSAEIKNGGVLEGRYGNGSSPEDAVNNHWEQMTVLNVGEYIVINATSDARFACRWNGFMWVQEREVC